MSKNKTKRKTTKRGRGGGSHLTDAETARIRAKLKAGTPTARVMDMFHVSLSTIANHRRFLRAEAKSKARAKGRKRAA